MSLVVACSGCGATYPVPSTLPSSGYIRCRRCKVLIPLHAEGSPKPVANPGDATDRTVIVGRVAPDTPVDLPPGTRVSLSVLDGPDKGQHFRITKTRTVIGRREGEVRLADPEVSGRHAVLTVHPGGCTVEDLKSTNGTSVNGARILARPVGHMDELGIGRTRLVLSIVQEADEVEGPAPPVEEMPPAPPKRLLVVEGSDLFQQKLLAALKGLEAVTVEVAEEARAEAALAGPEVAWDLLLVDLQLPSPPERNLLAALRARASQNRVPLVGMVGMIGLPDLLQLVAGLCPVALLDKAQPVDELRAAVVAALAPTPASPIAPLSMTGLTIRCSLGRKDLQGFLAGLGPGGARIAVSEVPEADSELQLTFILPEVSHLFRIAARVTNREWPRPGVALGTVDVQFTSPDPEARSRILAFLFVDARRRAAARTAEIGRTG